MDEIDLSKLLGGDAFTLSYTISNNGLGIKLSSLIDTGANGYTFIDYKFSKTVERFLGLQPIPLKGKCNVKGFDGKQATPITHYITLSLLIDRRKIQVPMLIVGLGEHNIIIGHKWFASTGVLIDCRNRRLLWPKEMPKSRA